MLFLFRAFAQSEEADEITAQSEERDRITISANYRLSSLNFSTKSIDSGSILTWRDIYLNGAYVNINFAGALFGYQRSNIGVGFSGSFNGYWTDDDTNNDYDVIFVATAEAYLLELNYEALSVDYGLNNGISHKLGFDCNMLFFRNYNAVPYMNWNSDPYGSIGGLTNIFDIYTLAFYYGVQAFYCNGNFYTAISGQAGIGIFLSLADWIYRHDLKHPVSFSYFGFSFSGESDFEIGFRFNGAFTLFSKALLMYEISPGLGLSTGYDSNDDIGVGAKFMELSRASFSVGIKISF